VTHQQFASFHKCYILIGSNQAEHLGKSIKFYNFNSILYDFTVFDSLAEWKEHFTLEEA